MNLPNATPPLGAYSYTHRTVNGYPVHTVAAHLEGPQRRRGVPWVGLVLLAALFVCALWPALPAMLEAVTHGP